MKFTELEKELRKEVRALKKQLEIAESKRVRAVRYLYGTFLKEPASVSGKLAVDVFEYIWGISVPKYHSLREASKHFGISEARCIVSGMHLIKSIRGIYCIGLEEYKKRESEE